MAFFGIGLTAQAQLAIETGQQASAANISIDAGTDGPSLGWISFVDDRTPLRSGVEDALGNSLRGFNALRLGEELSTGIRRPWTRRRSRLNATDYTQWSISGTVNRLGFDVMLGYSEPDAAKTPGTEALFKVKRQF